MPDTKHNICLLIFLCVCVCVGGGGGGSYPFIQRVSKTWIESEKKMVIQHLTKAKHKHIPLEKLSSCTGILAVP